ncbi:hypothetical protein [Clavibacter tessellarius]|uniref:hypothetical protein n=1 Tax=Clavibacter tessellarius TaxID=31965 RepID=UPI0032529FDD
MTSPSGTPSTEVAPPGEVDGHDVAEGRVGVAGGAEGGRPGGPGSGGPVEEDRGRGGAPSRVVLVPHRAERRAGLAGDQAGGAGIGSSPDGQ